MMSGRGRQPSIHNTPPDPTLSGRRPLFELGRGETCHRVGAGTAFKGLRILRAFYWPGLQTGIDFYASRASLTNFSTSSLISHSHFSGFLRPNQFCHHSGPLENRRRVTTSAVPSALLGFRNSASAAQGLGHAQLQLGDSVPQSR
jgi:hypothetical protein